MKIERFPLLLFFLFFVALEPSFAGESGTDLDLSLLGEEDVHVVADFISLSRTDGIVTAEGDVEIKRGERAIYASRILIDAESGRIEAEGDVVYVEPGHVITCDHAEVVIEEDTGILVMASMSIDSDRYRLDGDVIERIESGQYRAESAEFTPCRCRTGPPAWSFSARKMDLKVGDKATIRRGFFRIRNLPVFFIPYMVYPVSTERQSGFLMPGLSHSSRHGYWAELPFFLTLGPSADLTIIPEYMSERGVSGRARFRYVYRRLFEGEIYGHAIKDRLEGETRYRVSVLHDQNLWDVARFRADVLTVSDDLYPRDFMAGFAQRMSRQIESTIYLERGWEGLYMGAEFSKLEGLEDSAMGGAEINRMPEFRMRFLTRKPWPQIPLGYSVDIGFSDMRSGNGEIKRKRIDLFPRFSIPLSPLYGIRLIPDVGVRSVVSWKEGDEENERMNLVFASGARLEANVGRYYNGDHHVLKHIVRPFVDYRLRRHIREEAIPAIDGIDVDLSRNFLFFGIENEIYSRSKHGRPEGSAARRLLKLALMSCLDIDMPRKCPNEERDHSFGDIAAYLAASPRSWIDIEASTLYDWKEKALKNFSCALTLTTTREDSLSLGYQQGDSFDVDLRSRVEVLDSYVLPYEAEEIPKLLSMSSKIGLLRGLMLKLSSRYFPDHAEQVEYLVGLRYRSLSECWAIETTMRRTQRPKEFTFTIGFDLMGFK
ncbi:LPS-assembly protein LptD [Thermodesulfobacteriota bacterium]